MRRNSQWMVSRNWRSTSCLAVRRLRSSRCIWGQGWRVALLSKPWLFRRRAHRTCIHLRVFQTTPRRICRMRRSFRRRPQQEISGFRVCRRRRIRWNLPQDPALSRLQKHQDHLIVKVPIKDSNKVSRIARRIPRGAVPLVERMVATRKQIKKRSNLVETKWTKGSCEIKEAINCKIACGNKQYRCEVGECKYMN